MIIPQPIWYVMFTGIIRTIGTISSLQKKEGGLRLTIDQEILDEISIGDSIAVDGCCLTVVEINQNSWSADIVSETLQRTTFKNKQVGDPVNIERPLTLGSPLDGHLVQGHIDGIAHLSEKKELPCGSCELIFTPTPELLSYFVDKGSVAIDGISLTIATVQKDSFSIAMIPHTAKITTLGTKKVGTTVNIEVDLLAKYAEKLLTPYAKKGT